MPATRTPGLFWNVLITSVPRPPAPITPRLTLSAGAAYSIAPPLIRKKDRLFIQDFLASEQQFHSQRKNTPGAGRVDRSESARWIPARVESDRRAYAGEVSVIENVERLSAELQLAPVGELQVLQQAEIPVLESRDDQNIAPAIAPHAGRHKRGVDE